MNKVVVVTAQSGSVELQGRKLRMINTTTDQKSLLVVYDDENEKELAVFNDWLFWRNIDEDASC